MKRVTKNCAYCDAEFTPARRDALYCSASCRTSAYYVRVNEQSRKHNEQFQKLQQQRTLVYQKEQAEKQQQQILEVNKFKNSPVRYTNWNEEDCMNLSMLARLCYKGLLTVLHLSKTQTQVTVCDFIRFISNLPNIVFSTGFHVFLSIKEFSDFKNECYPGLIQIIRGREYSWENIPVADNDLRITDKDRDNTKKITLRLKDREQKQLEQLAVFLYPYQQENWYNRPDVIIKQI